MDPASVISLVASCVGIADVVAKLGCRLRQVGEEFRGALDHIESLSQQAATIELAVSEISLILRRGDDTFPPTFISRLIECTKAISKTAGDVQDYTQSLKQTAQTSRRRARSQYVWHVNQISQWEKTLGFQIQALTLLLQVSLLQTCGEKENALEKDSSVRCFQRASSLSCIINTSSLYPSSVDPSECATFAVIQRFEFDAELLQTKVYRRACEVALKRQVTLHDFDTKANLITTYPTSSAHAEITQEHSEKVQELPTLSGVVTTNPKPFDGHLTSSTLATTFSSYRPSDTMIMGIHENLKLEAGILVIVSMQDVGSDTFEIPICADSSYPGTIQVCIAYFRDFLLVARGLDPTLVRSTLESCIIQPVGVHQHAFPFTPTFFAGALEKFKEGYYTALVLHTDFQKSIHVANIGPSSTGRSSRHSLTGMSPISESDPAIPHFEWEASNPPPYSEKELLKIGKGAFGVVYEIKMNQVPCSLRDVNGASRLALKVVKRESHAKPEMNAYRKLPKCRQHKHVIDPLASWQHRGIYYLLIPLADMNLRDLWSMERNELISRTNSSADSVLWVLNQCTGLAGALDKVHEGLNKPNSQSKSKDEPSKQTRTGHLHDIKLENILVFREHGSGNEITLKLADFSCARIKEFVHRGLANLDGSGTPSYRAPEFDLPVADRRLGLPYDVWSLGAVFLELITWFLNGRNGVEEFGLDRRKYGKDQAFFLNAHRGLSYHPAVLKQVKSLQLKAAALGPPFDGALLVFLALITSCLRLEQDKRPTAGVLARQCEALRSRLRATISAKDG